jgi:hypothetical protein
VNDWESECHGDVSNSLTIINGAGPQGPGFYRALSGAASFGLLSGFAGGEFTPRYRGLRDF